MGGSKMTAINTNTMNFTITFRTKFEKLLNDENRPVVLATFKQFCNLDSKTTIARDVLWDLTYSESSALRALNQLCLNPAIISAENTLKLRDELRYQYEKLHIGYLTSYIPEEYASAFNALSKKTDTIIASVIYDATMYYFRFGDVNRTLFLLNSDKENFFFGGIRELGFSAVEADYLKPYHMQIHDFIKAIYDFNILTQKKADGHHEDSHEFASNYRRVIAENVIMHRDIFTAFTHSDDLNVLPAIANLGFDLNEVMVKKENIHNLIIAIDEKEKAEAKLLEAYNSLNCN